MAPLQRFRVREKLLKILESAGATEKLFTTREILSYLGKYIEQNRLHDNKNMRIVRCQGDPLEDVFGVREFTIDSFQEMWNFIFPLIIPATNREVLQSENKQLDTYGISLSDDKCLATKLDMRWMSQLPWWYFVERNNTKNDHDMKTVSGSVMTNSTAYVKDTEYSDFSSCVGELSNEEGFAVEYEPDSCSSTDSDGTEPYYESEEETTYSTPSIPLTDSSEGTIGEDFWGCAECPNMNPPTIGYCQRCWKMRKHWLNPPEPTLQRSYTMPLNAEDTVPALPRWSSQPQGIDVVDGIIKEFSNRQSYPGTPSLPSRNHKNDPNLHGRLSGQCQGPDWDDVPPLPPRTGPYYGFDISKNEQTLKRRRSPDESEAVASKKTMFEGLSYNNQTPSQDTPSSSKLIISKSHSTDTPLSELGPTSSNRQSDDSFSSLPFNKSQPPEMPGICNICRSHPNDASFIHGKVGHQYCCYKCALKVQKRQRKCPVCRDPIELVIKNYIFQM